MTTTPSAQRPGGRPATKIAPGMRIVFGRESIGLDADHRWIYRWTFPGPDGGGSVVAAVEDVTIPAHVHAPEQPGVRVVFTDGDAHTFCAWSRDWKEVR